MMNEQNLSFRNLTTEDAQVVMELIDRCETAEYGESDSDIEDLLNDWEQIDLNQDAQLAFTSAGKLVGYAAVMPWSANLRYDFFADPEWENEELGKQMLAFCIQRGPAFALSHDISPQSDATIYIAHTNQRDRIVVEGAGFKPVRYHFQMQIELKTLLDEPVWPEGIDLRNVTPEQDSQEIHALIETAFARPDRTPTTFKIWKEFMMRPDIFDPSLWYLALAGETIVGVCLCFAYPEIGWVRQLAVAENWRRHGLGSALLKHAFNEFKQRGFKKAGLTVAGENTNAYSVYQKAGMQRLRQYDQYERSL